MSVHSVGNRPRVTTSGTQAPAEPAKTTAPAAPAPQPAAPKEAPLGTLIKPRVTNDTAPPASKLSAAVADKASRNVDVQRALAGVDRGRVQAASPGIVEMREGQRLNTERAEIQKQLKTDPTKAAERLSQLSRYDMSEVLQGMSKPEIKQLADVARAGKGSPDMALGVAIELGAHTTWARTHGENIEHLRTQFVSGHLNMVDDPDGNARTKNDLAYTSGREVNVRTDLARSPEVLASTILHEGVHSKHAVDKDNISLLDNETEAHVTEAQVWGELRPKDASGENVQQLDENRARYTSGGEAGVKASVAAEYAFGFSKTKPDITRQMLEGLANDPAARAQLTREDVTRLALAAGNVANKARKGDDWKTPFREELGRLNNALKGTDLKDHAVEVITNEWRANAGNLLREMD